MVELDFDLERDVPELTGKVILVTGGTNGLGAATARMLARRNPARIYITGRKKTAAEHIIADIKSTGSQDRSSVKKAAEEISKASSRLDILIANAGVMALPPALTKDVYELHFGINHLAHALLIRKLLGLLQETARRHGEARILPVSSLALVVAPRSHGIVFEDLKTTQAYWILGKWQRNTGLVTSLSFFDRAFVRLGNIGRFLEDDQGHWNTLWAAGVPKDRAKQGELYEPVGKLTDGYTHWCLDEKLAVKLWDWTEEELKPWLT
ncbi:NAD(P)-binding protein [Xylariomycetidae sp. FL2044]|nr:NAD(P)-binding protein [Xylariomycetidae sp. FL2044]